jgi:hypothetical protein
LRKEKNIKLRSAQTAPISRVNRTAYLKGILDKMTQIIPPGIPLTGVLSGIWYSWLRRILQTYPDPLSPRGYKQIILKPAQSFFKFLYETNRMKSQTT